MNEIIYASFVYVSYWLCFVCSFQDIKCIWQKGDKNISHFNKIVNKCQVTIWTLTLGEWILFYVTVSDFNLHQISMLVVKSKSGKSVIYRTSNNPCYLDKSDLSFDKGQILTNPSIMGDSSYLPSNKRDKSGLLHQVRQIWPAHQWGSLFESLTNATQQGKQIWPTPPPQGRQIWPTPLPRETSLTYLPELILEIHGSAVWREECSLELFNHSPLAVWTQCGRHLKHNEPK